MQKHILLVDDDALLQELITLSLEADGYAIHKANDGRQAMALLQSTSVDLIVLDMMMPVLDGLKFLRWLRQERKQDTPVLALTAMQRPNSEQEILAQGASAVAFKPVDLSTLAAAVKDLLA